MSTEIAIVERQLAAIKPRLSDLLASVNIPPARLMQSIVVSCDRTPELLNCDRDTLLSSAVTAAALGLECDGPTAQAYLLPFNDRRRNRKIVQLVVGYKGYNTMAARSGFTINGGVVREGDRFEYRLGSSPAIEHVPLLGRESERQIIAAWAVATHRTLAPIVPRPLSIDELMAIKSRAPGAKRADSPWNDAPIGFPAMCEKSAKRRLARAMPLNTMVHAAAMEDAQELGRGAWVDPDQGGVIIEGELQAAGEPSAPPPVGSPQRWPIARADGETGHCRTEPEWVSAMLRRIESIADTAGLAAFTGAQLGHIESMMGTAPEACSRLLDELEQAKARVGG